MVFQNKTFADVFFGELKVSGSYRVNLTPPINNPAIAYNRFTVQGRGGAGARGGVHLDRSPVHHRALSILLVQEPSGG